MKRLTGLLLALLMLAAPVANAAANTVPAAAAPADTRMISTQTVIDTDGSDGYSGDYVVILNPNESPSSRMSTGNMSGKIITEVEEHPASAGADTDGAFLIDVDGKLAEQAREMGLDKPPASQRSDKSVSFEVGDTYTFMVLNYNPLPTYYVEFEVLAKGEHCYIWTPTSTAANVWPLDEIDPSFAQMAADTFDSKFDLMQSSFGDHDNGSDGDGRLNILYYNIDDGWQPGQGYVGGYFSAYDLYINGMPILNIDTYPGVHYVSPEGEVTNDISRTYNTMVHEYQHLINYSECGYTDTWINECMSAAAEEICFPGSSVSRRIMSWINYDFRDNDDWDNPPVETEYNPEFTLQNGFAMYDWSNDIETADLLVLYAQVSLFAQFIYTRHGNTFFHSLMQQLVNGSSFSGAYRNITGQNAADLVADYRVALTANTTQEEYDGRYGFKPQEGYDPAEYHDVQNLYSLLCPVVFTGTACQISGGGAICVKPVDGVYYPPSGAATGLKYYGITRNNEPPAPVPLSGVSLEVDAAKLYVGSSMEIRALVQPGNASDYTIEWSVSDPEIISLSAEGDTATVTGLAPGAAVVTAQAYDNVTGETYTASATVTVREFIFGDVDGDGTVTANDALLALRYSLGIIELTPEQLARADVDCSGAVNANDALWILRRSLGLV